MKWTSLSPAALLLAFAGPAAAQYNATPTTPAYPTPSNPASAPEEHSLSTNSGPRNTGNKTADQDLVETILKRAIQRNFMPQASGEVKTAPADAAVIRVRVPDADARVLFDGEDTYTAGTTRYFVTAPLEDGKAATYKVSARWKQGGDGVTRERDVQVAPGQITVVDLTRPVGP